MVGGQSNPYLAEGGWESSLNYRYLFSSRHFTGDHEDTERQNENTDVQNTFNLFDLDITRGVTERLSVSLDIPYLMATRSSMVRKEDGSNFQRSEVQVHALGDVSLSAKVWIFQPSSNPYGNIGLGIGVKAPTGDPGVEDVRQTNPTDGKDVLVKDIRTVDQSIQPGDGGWGFPVSLRAFQGIYEGMLGAYASGTWLINPEGKNGVLTYRSAKGEEVMSVPDQFVASAGFWYAPTFLPGFSARLGCRAEGIPIYDLIGRSYGFRRPGISIAVDPGISYGFENWSLSLSVPFTQIGQARIGYRNRWISVPDKENDRHGDAAFADYLILLGITHRF